MKRCIACGVEKPLSDFYLCPSGYHWAKCNLCLKAYRKAYFLANREREYTARRAWTAAHPEYRARDVARTREWVKANPERARMNNRAKAKTRRARETGAGGRLSAAEWQVIIEAFDGRCAYCGERVDDLTQDHVQPLSRGGEHSVWNVVPACMSCNSSKGVKAPPVHVQPLLLVA